MSSETLLRNIRDSARCMVELIQQRYPHIQGQKQLAAKADIAIPALHLPYPSDIISLICTLPLPKQTTSTLCERVSHWHQALNCQLALKFEQSCRELLPKLSSDKTAFYINALLRAYQASYSERYVPLIKADIMAIKDRTSERGGRHKKTRFNSQYVPLLEKYFLRNAYPSACHRANLAHQTKMTERQIEVWFQNHRNRSKKDGKPLKRLASDSISVEVLIGDSLPMPLEEETQYTSSDEFSDEETVPFCSTFSASSPPHAFPTSYPPNCSVDPFPRINGSFVFPPPVWLRKPVTIPVKHADISPDDFTALFSSKLTLRCPRDVDSKKSGGTKRPPWHSSRTTILPPAPHPALVRSLYSYPSITKSTTHHAPGSQQPLKSCRWMSASLSSCTSLRPKPCKQYPFSLRLPTSITSFDAFSRASSDTSIDSLHGRLASTSSQSSIEPNTPPLSPIIEPHIAGQFLSDFSELFIPDSDQLLKGLPSPLIDLSSTQYLSTFAFPLYRSQELEVW